MWLIFAILSVVFGFVGFVMIFRKNKFHYLASCFSLAFVSLTLLNDYLLVVEYVNKGDFGALEDFMPYTYQNVIVYVFFMVIANLLMIIGSLLVKKIRK